MTDSSRYGTSLFTSPGVTSSAGMPQALAWLHRRRSSIIRSGVRATSMPPLCVNTPSSSYCAVLSSVSSNIIREYSIGKMKLDAWPVEPPGFGIGPLSTRTRSRQPSCARWCTRLLPTMPAPMMTALARAGVSVINHPASRGWSIPVRSSAAVRHCSAAWSWLKVNRCSPVTPAPGAVMAGAARSRKRSGLYPPGTQNRRIQPGCLVMKRADSEAPATARPARPAPPAAAG